MRLTISVPVGDGDDMQFDARWSEGAIPRVGDNISLHTASFDIDPLVHGYEMELVVKQVIWTVDFTAGSPYVHVVTEPVQNPEHK